MKLLFSTFNYMRMYININLKKKHNGEHLFEIRSSDKECSKSKTMSSIIKKFKNFAWKMKTFTFRGIFLVIFYFVSPNFALELGSARRKDALLPDKSGQMKK